MPTGFDIKSHEQLEAMALPIRTEIVEIVSCLGPCSIRDLARIMDRKRPLLHFHVARLVDVGLLSEAGERGEGTRREQLYRTLGGPLFVVYDRDDPFNVEMTVRYSKNVLARAQRQLAKSFSSGAAVTDGKSRDTHATQVTAWLSNSELARVNQLIDELQGLLKPSPKIEGKQLLSLTLGLAPLHPKGVDDK
jgi:hypothetical protein